MGLFSLSALFLTLQPGRSTSHPSDPEKVDSTQHTAEGNSSDDVTLLGTSLYSRLKSYLWPTDDKNPDLDSLVPNYRWTPIISGIVIPFSILLEIPGLTERWYIRTEGGKTVETRKNPVVLEIGLGISIACGLIANVALVLRFLEKRVQTVTLLCIVFLTTHGGSTTLAGFRTTSMLTFRRCHQYRRRHRVWSGTSFRRWLHVRRGLLDDTLLYDRFEYYQHQSNC